MLQHLHATPEPPDRVVVLGAAGFIGNALVKRLERSNYPVLPLTRKDIDLLDRDAGKKLSALLRPADTFVAVAARAPCRDAKTLAENMQLAAAMIEALTKSPVAHVINISSDAVYADSPAPLTEASVMAPDTLHGAMHLAREIAFRVHVRAPLAILRPSLIYGPGDPHNGYGPNRFRRLANERQDIVLFGKGEERRDHVFIDDVAEVIVRVIERRSTGALNIATGTVHSFREIAERVVAEARAQVAIKETARTGPMPHNGYRPFDISACRAAFPDFVYTPLAEGIAQAQREYGAFA
ncbi:MAG TPA: NAD(P)-dependent oxidoreductase [Xanthobacteraceae bacterium]|nr:NAD(P)-dependent oxidoreductase [Xanthobacteraceae bacterium]